MAGTYVYNVLRLFSLPIQGKERIWECGWQTIREQSIFFFLFGWKLFFLPHIFRVTDSPWKGLLEGILFLNERISWIHDNESHISGDLEWYIFSISWVLTDNQIYSYITLASDCSHEIKRRLILGRKAMTNIDSVCKSRHHVANKGPYNQNYGLSSRSCTEVRLGT